MHWSTVISDGVLALVSLGLAEPLLRHPVRQTRLAGAGLALIGLAAVFGTLRYGGLSVTASHTMLSSLAGTVGVPLIGLAWVGRVGNVPLRPLWFVITALLVTWLVTGFATDVPLARTLLGALAMLAVIGASGVAARRHGVAAVYGAGGAVLTLVVGLVVGSEGAWLGVPRVDLFHVGLAAANALFAAGLWRLDR